MLSTPALAVVVCAQKCPIQYSMCSSAPALRPAGGRASHTPLFRQQENETKKKSYPEIEEDKANVLASGQLQLCSYVASNIFVPIIASVNC